VSLPKAVNIQSDRVGGGGVLGDWGSGKSSLMGLARAELMAEAGARYAWPATPLTAA
jgi:hypothetical protein